MVSELQDHENKATQDIRGSICSESVFDRFVLELRLRPESVKKRVGKQTPNVGDDGEKYDCLPGSTKTRQKFGKVIIVRQERAFESANTGEKEVCTRPLILGKGIRGSLIVGKFEEMEDLHILNNERI